MSQYGLSQVAGTNGNINRKVIHTLPKNINDKCTIVSLFPREIVETKPTTFPGRFVIPAAPENGFSLLVVDPASYYLASQNPRQPPNEFQINSALLANSIVQDYINSIAWASPGKRPGVFWINGAHDEVSILHSKDENGVPFLTRLKMEEQIQKDWFLEVVKQADSLWARSNGNPTSIMEDARVGALRYGLKDKPWMGDAVASELKNCFSCGELVNYSYPTCKHCKAIINPEKAKELNLMFVNQSQQG